MDEDEQLRNIVRWRKKPKPNGTVRLSDVVEQLMEAEISPRQGRFAAAAEAWSQLLPAELAGHCRIAGISGSRLKVEVDSPSYLHELLLCSAELLAELQQSCPRAKIREIKFVIG